MKTTITAAAVFLCLTGITKAQDYKLSWGTVAKAGSSDAVYLPLGYDGGNYYSIKVDNGDGTLLKVDHDQNLASQTPMVITTKKFEADIAFLRNKKVVLLNSDYDSGDKATTVTASIYSMDGKPTGFKMKKVSTFTVEKNTEHADLLYYYSLDSSMLAIVMDHDMPNKDDSKVSVSVIKTDDLTELWHTSASLPYDDDDFATLSGAVDAAGNFLLLSVIRGGEGKRLEKYSTRMFTFSAKDQKYTDRELKIEGKYISSAFIQFASGNQLMITGFYNDLKENGKNEGIEGAFMCMTDATTLENLDLRVLKMDPIAKAAVAPSSGFAKFIGTDELNGYFIRKINLDPDGSGYVIAEQRYIVESDNGNYRTRTYYFNHLLVYHFDTNKDIEWITGIPKAQVSSITTPKIGIGPVSFWFFTSSQVRMAYKYNSFTALKKDDKIYILYNDHRDNGDARTYKDVKVMMNKNKANAVIVAVDANGKWEKTPLFIGKDVDVILETSSSYPINGIGFTLSAERGKDLQFGKVEL